VLVVDDFADSRDLYAEYLADAGFRTDTARTATRRSSRLAR
jgi:DNA-binding response OmpR family regulator